MKPRVMIFTFLLCAFTVSLSARSAERFWEVMPYVWFTGIEGTMTIEGQLTGIDASIADVWDNSNTGGSFRCETWKGGNGFYADLFFVNLTGEYGDDENKYVPAINIFFVDLAYNHQLGSTPVFIDQQSRDNEEIRHLSFGVLVGGRYFHLENSLESTTDENVSQTGQFIDPLVGGYLHYRMAESITLAASGDIGGFGIGSDFTWNAWARMDFRIAQWFWVDAMYRAFDIDYEDGEGDDKIGLDAQIGGPAVGLIFRF